MNLRTINVATKTLYIITVMGLPVEVEEHEPGYLLGTVQILGHDHHLELIEIAPNDSDGCQQPHLHLSIDGCEEGNNNDTRYANLLNITDEAMDTVQLDGREFVCVVTPYGR